MNDLFNAVFLKYLLTRRALPLEGVKVLDLFWVLAGPAATRVLAEYGATVVHVESTRRLDTIRAVPPYKGSAPGPENGAPVQGANAGKLCVTLDLARPESRPVIEALVRWADVVTESFAPGVAARMGLDYESLRRIKPDLIVISSCLMGQTGSLREFAGFGNLAASVTGFQLYAGWPDRAPAGPAGAYTDTCCSSRTRARCSGERCTTCRSSAARAAGGPSSTDSTWVKAN